MKLFNAILETPAAIKPVLAPGERLEKSYSASGTMLLFTNRRLMLTPDQEASEPLTYHALPYRNITHFGVDPAETDPAASVLTLWIAGVADPLHIPLENSAETQQLQRTLADYVLNRHSPWLNKQLAMSRQKRLRPLLAAGLTGAALMAALHIRKLAAPPQKNDASAARTALKTLIQKQLLR